MFLPENVNSQQQEEKERKEAYKRIEEWALLLVPNEYRADATISVQEVQCGDPECSPIDTGIAITFPSGGQGLFGMPMMAKEVTEEELQHFFPTPDVLEAWHKGEEADWPKTNEAGGLTPDDLPALRFEVGTSVLCRVGPQEWAPGTVSQLWYREPNWPPDSWAPYKISLDNGTDIFAPGDMDQIIKLNPDK